MAYEKEWPVGMDLKQWQLVNRAFCGMPPPPRKKIKENEKNIRVSVYKVENKIL